MSEALASRPTAFLLLVIPSKVEHGTAGEFAT
jgi:hypothetical protein